VNAVFMRQRTRNWVSSSKALDTPLQSGGFADFFKKQYDSPRVSAGTILARATRFSFGLLYITSILFITYFLSTAGLAAGRAMARHLSSDK